MGKINVLSKNVSELIAAGEVVERPASIIKELLENCIDAKATAITIEIKNGGIRYIRVTDNGIGMEKEDLSVALLRHATSKISHKNDLESICTLGFRGEALASVCAVSKMEVITKQANTDFGYKITADAGQIFPVEQAGCQNGTTVIVKDLFYNVPARMKFLKRDSAEANVIGGIIEKIALSHSEISFKFISDGNIKILTPGNGKLIDSINTILGREIASNMLSVDSTNNGVKVSGFISKTNYTRTNRGMQHFFVNGRYVRSKVCMSAIEEGYKSSIMIGKFPLCVLNIEIPYNCVDINVHPAKIEVRFTDEKMVFDAIYFAVKQAILKIERFVPPPISPMKNESAEQIPLNYIKEPAVKEIVLEDKTAPVNSFKTDNDLPKVSNVKPLVLQLNSNKADYNTQEEYSYINKESFVKQQNKPTIILEEPEEAIENSNDIVQQVEFIYI
ncbi:MAG: DNA mismatch repair endonuclease MutL, partial [Oscillospiraceae bacterium]